MSLHLLLSLFSFLIVFNLYTCTPKEVSSEIVPIKNKVDQQLFNEYWYNGKAELNHYDLTQARYGEIHKGDAILIFVTEDFLLNKQVKLESLPQSNQATSVMKVNFIKHFQTGLYDYSIMTSVFTPINIDLYPKTLKVTTSIQDWCGHVWSQLNYKKNQYELKGFSYFEKESDTHIMLPSVWLEDEIWTKLRINPSLLPIDTCLMIPSATATRLRHLELLPEKVSTTIDTSSSDTSHYKILFPVSQRMLVINFQKSFPFQIYSWEETYVDGSGGKAKKLSTRGVLKKSIMSDYWSKNTLADSTLRKEFGL